MTLHGGLLFSQQLDAELWNQCRNLNRHFCVTLHSPTPLCLLRSMPEVGSFCPKSEKLLCVCFGLGLEKNLGPAGALDFKCPWDGTILIQSKLN